MTEQSASDAADSQAQDLENPNLQDPKVPAASTPEQSMAPIVRLITFEQKKGEEVLDFNTIFYDKEKKSIVKRTGGRLKLGDCLVR